MLLNQVTLNNEVLNQDIKSFSYIDGTEETYSKAYEVHMVVNLGEQYRILVSAFSKQEAYNRANFLLGMTRGAIVVIEFSVNELVSIN